MSSHPSITENISTHSRNELVAITHIIAKHVREKNIEEGFAIVYVPHTTAAITINENADPDVKHDMLQKLSEMIPHAEKYYQHAEGNSDSHVKASLVGSSVTILIERGKLLLGRWQGVYFCEFDGPRERQVHIKLVQLNPPRADS